MKTERRKNARPPITELAALIENDIKSRRLSTGDPYLGLSETARMLKTSNAGANSALQLLVKKGVLERKQRRGTFIREPGDLDPQSIRRVHFLLNEDFLKKEGVLADGQVIGIQSELSRAEIQFNFLPQHDQREYVEKAVNEALATEGLDAFVLYSTSLDAQRILVESGLPTVVVGSLYPSITELPWIDQDQKAVAQISFEHLYLEKQCQQFLVLMRERAYPGDYLYLDSLQECFSKYNISQQNIYYRSLPTDASAIQAEVSQLLPHFQSTVGIIARSMPLGIAAKASLDPRINQLQKNVFILVTNVFGKEREELRDFSYIRPQPTPEEVGIYIGKTLKQFVQNGFTGNTAWQVPIKLITVQG
ncbi:GntR family transcriptional regulator [Gimesia sp.]|uniref:GntR family transcriptional regulator n=1 Tax=Gimesia sp. TaxID=2024833 RepID=UPI003A928099